MTLDPDHQQSKLHGRNPLSDSDFLHSPGCDVILVNPEGRSITVERLALTLGRLMAQDPNRRVEFWIKLLD